MACIACVRNYGMTEGREQQPALLCFLYSDWKSAELSGSGRATDGRERGLSDDHSKNADNDR